MDFKRAIQTIDTRNKKQHVKKRLNVHCILLIEEEKKWKVEGV